MSDQGDTFDDSDEVLIEALAGGATYAEAGALVHRSDRTVRRRMTDEEFARLVSARRSERMSEVTGDLVALSRQAVAVFRDGMDAINVYPRMRAAQLVLNFSLRYRAAGELEARLEAIERRLAAADEEPER